MANEWDIFNTIPTEETKLDGFDWSIFDKQTDQIEGATVSENEAISSFREKCLQQKSENLSVNGAVTKIRELKKIAKANPKNNKSKWDFSLSPEQQKLKDFTHNTYQEGYQYMLRKDFQNGITNDFINDLNKGCKLHLNISPENTLLVSRWLKINNFAHKLLSGGDIENGKIFTVYIGSYDLCTKMSSKIFNALNQYLCKPADDREIEFESGIIGRFVDDSKDFEQYGTCGFSLKSDTKNMNEDQRALLSFRELKTKYGDYFLPDTL
jgi:hypothetical protein